MIPRCTTEEKQHMIDNIQELRGIVADTMRIRQLPKADRDKVVSRMTEIQKEIKEFRRKYPND